MLNQTPRHDKVYIVEVRGLLHHPAALSPRNKPPVPIGLVLRATWTEWQNLSNPGRLTSVHQESVVK